MILRVAGFMLFEKLTLYDIVYMILFFFNFADVNFVVCLPCILTLLHSERPKLDTILAFLSAIGLRVNSLLF